MKKDLDLLIVHPGGAHGIYGPLGDEIVASEPPPVARMIGGYARDLEKNVDIIDQDAERVSDQKIAHHVDFVRPRLVAIVVSGHQPSASTQAMTAAGSIAREIKREVPNQKIVMLGNHPSALPERTLREEAVDYVIDGEGPISIMGLLNGDDPATIPGLVWWEGDKVACNRLAPLIEDLDADLHGDTWDLLPMTSYWAHNWHAMTGPRAPYASIYTTLGCPFACSFCMINTFQHARRYRRHSPEFVVAQIEKLYHNYGVRSIKVADEMFILREEHYGAIAEGLCRLPFANELNIWAYARVDTVKPETLALLRAAGFRWLALGIESGDADVRDGADKRLRTSDIVGTVRAIQAAGINVIGNFMFGFRDDTMETMQATLSLALECLPEFANFYTTMAYPGSKLYDQALAEGWTLPETWAGYSQHNRYTRPLDTKHVSAAEVLRFRDEAFVRYFSDPRYEQLIAGKFGAETVGHVRKMLGYTLERDLLR
jgi:anaerobic magnesium-protoporphyrin IX monomethyl ester cyclase